MPLPDDRHAVSVCLPTWDSVIGYEEAREKVTKRMKCGYPRFFRHPAINRLFAEAQNILCSDGEAVVVFPNTAAAQRAQRFVEQRHKCATRITSYESLQALIMPEEHFATAMEYWRYTGEVVSSRQAADLFEENQPQGVLTSDLRSRLSGYTGSAPENIFIYESGMASAFAAFRAATSLNPSKKTLQLEFPYVDVLKIQNHFGQGVVYLNECAGEPMDEAIQRMREGEFSAVFCEVPSNPLLRSVDLETISQACREGGIPLIVDDTICSCFNVDVRPFADIVTTSLTKWLSGKGDVMVGGLQLIPESPFYQQLSEFFAEDNPSGSKLYSSDASVFYENMTGFEERMITVNENSLKVVDLLVNHPNVKQVWYPTTVTREQYDAVRKENGGYGGLISFALKSPKKAPKVFDALEISKGPSLGTEFSLACPYTLLAHYDELDWVEDCGVPTNLIRLSIGIEPVEELLERLEKALG